MPDDGTVESVEETISSGNARIEASRRMIDDLDRRLSRGSELLAADGTSDAEPTE